MAVLHYFAECVLLKSTPNWAYMIDCFFLFQYLRQIYSDDCQVFDALYHDDLESRQGVFMSRGWRVA